MGAAAAHTLRHADAGRRRQPRPLGHDRGPRRQRAPRRLDPLVGLRSPGRHPHQPVPGPRRQPTGAGGDLRLRAGGTRDPLRFAGGLPRRPRARDRRQPHVEVVQLGDRLQSRGRAPLSAALHPAGRLREAPEGGGVGRGGPTAVRVALVGDRPAAAVVGGIVPHRARAGGGTRRLRPGPAGAAGVPRPQPRLPDAGVHLRRDRADAGGAHRVGGADLPGPIRVRRRRRLHGRAPGRRRTGSTSSSQW